MNSSLKTPTILALAVLCSWTFLFAANPKTDPLWCKAVAVATANADWVPGLASTRTEIFNKGEVVAVHEMWQRSKPGPNGEVVMETVKMLEDGKEVTKSEKKKNEKKNATKKSFIKEGGNPFDESVQDRLSLKVIDRFRTIAGWACVGYDFELRNTNSRVARGAVWLEKETGVPLEIEEMTMDTLPDSHLKQLSSTTLYEITTNGTWLVKTMTTKFTYSKFFFKVDARATTTFSEHWKKAQHELTFSKERN